MKPEDVLREVVASKLRGRGGAGFHAALSGRHAVKLREIKNI